MEVTINKIQYHSFASKIDTYILNCFLYQPVVVSGMSDRFPCENTLVTAGNDDDFGGLLSASLILLRNRLLDNLLRLLFTTKEKCSVNAQ